jgi:hypothetical protein
MQRLYTIFYIKINFDLVTPQKDPGFHDEIVEHLHISGRLGKKCWLHW